jgi:hypothetical protein
VIVAWIVVFIVCTPIVYDVVKGAVMRINSAEICESPCGHGECEMKIRASWNMCFKCRRAVGLDVDFFEAFSGLYCHVTCPPAPQQVIAEVPPTLWQRIASFLREHRAHKSART